MTIKEANDLVDKLYNVMNPVHRKYNHNLESNNLNKAYDLCGTLTTEEKRAVEYMLLCDRNIGIRYLNKNHKFTSDREVSQEGCLSHTIKSVVYECDRGGEVDVIEKEAKKKLLSIFPMI